MPGEVTQCGGCGSDAADLIPLLDMGIQPLPESLGPSKRYPLNLVRCMVCGLVQLDFIPDPQLVFKKSHPYSTGNSAALREHYQGLARELTDGLLIDDVVVDIGANDGTLLRCYPSGPGQPDQGRSRAYRPGQEDHARHSPGRRGSSPRSWRPACGTGTARPGWSPPAMSWRTCRTRTTSPRASARCWLTTGCSSRRTTTSRACPTGLQIDTVYHEHLRYYTPGTFAFLLERHGLKVERIVPVDTHGGSFRTYARKVKPNFPHRARAAATGLRATLWKLNNEKKVIWGVSAATRATPLIHYSGIADFITCIAEVEGSDKLGTRIRAPRSPLRTRRR